MKEISDLYPPPSPEFSDSFTNDNNVIKRSTTFNYNQLLNQNRKSSKKDNNVDAQIITELKDDNCAERQSKIFCAWGDCNESVENRMQVSIFFILKILEFFIIFNKKNF